MCVNGYTSIITFFISVFSSIILVKYGLDKYKKENLIACLFFIYMSLIQILEFFIWSDINDIIWDGNLISSKISAFFVFTQPVILYIIKLFVIQPNVFNWSYATIEILFFIYALYCFNNFLTLQKNKSSFPDNITGFLNWSWFNYMDYIIYFTIFILSIFIYIDFRFAIISCIWLFSILDLSYYIVPKNYGMLFCFITAFSPLFVLIWEILFM